MDSTSPRAVLDGDRSQTKTEAALSVSYAVVFTASLFLTLETEPWHWLSMVFVPAAILYVTMRRESRTLSAVLRSCGLEKGRLVVGMPMAAVVGVAIMGLVLFASRNRADMVSQLSSWVGVQRVLLAFVLVLFTAGFTEEFLFRGVIQTRLAALFRSQVLAVTATTVLFSLYHLPYAYLHPKWPSHGDLGAALGASFGEGALLGVILGIVYVRSKGNLLASVLVHAMIDTLPATVLLSQR